jgi:hypothetical protein
MLQQGGARQPRVAGRFRRDDCRKGHVTNRYRIDQVVGVNRYMDGPFWVIRNPVEGVIDELDNAVLCPQ